MSTRQNGRTPDTSAHANGHPPLGWRVPPNRGEPVAVWLDRCVERAADAAKLSPSERRVLPFVLTDLTVEETAESLDMTQRTVSQLLHRIYAKTGEPNARGALLFVLFGPATSRRP